MKSSKRRLQALTEGSDGMPNYLKMEDSETSIPPVFRSRLHELFSQIEKEFDLLYTENLNRKSTFDTYSLFIFSILRVYVLIFTNANLIVLVQEKIDILSEKLEKESCVGDRQNLDYIEFETSGKNSKVKCKYLFFMTCNVCDSLILM